MPVYIGLSKDLVCADQSKGKIAGGSPIPVVTYKTHGNGHGAMTFCYEWVMQCVPYVSPNDLNEIHYVIIKDLGKITGRVHLSMEVTIPLGKEKGYVWSTFYDVDDVVKKICQMLGANRRSRTVDWDIMYLDKIISFEGLLEGGPDSADCESGSVDVETANLFELLSHKIQPDTFRANVRFNI